MLALFGWFFGTINRMETATQQAFSPATPDSFSLEKLLQKLARKDDVIAKKSHVISEQQKRIEQLEAYLRLEKSRHYGARSEKNPNQGELFNEAEQLADEASDEETEAAEDKQPAKKRARSRKGLSDKLPRIQIHLDLTEEEKAGAINTFYSKVKEELDIIPAQVRVLEYLQEKAVFQTDDGQQTLKAAERSPHPLGKSIASVNLLAYLIVAKYCDALPLYRLEKILARYGGEITRSCMANWIIRLSDVFMPLINLMKEHQIGSHYLQMDDKFIRNEFEQLQLAA